MKKIFLLGIVFLISCAPPKKFIYLSEGGSDPLSIQTVKPSYDSKIQPDDILSISITSKTPELTLPFNQGPSVSSAGTDATTSNSSYLVNSEGDIVFPILGKIYVAGLTHKELAKQIETELIDKNYIKDPTVFVRLLNFKVSVLGEVKAPGVKKFDSERVTIFDALGTAGDLTLYALRNNIAIVREENGERKLSYVDISNREIFNSPYYYLHPNDIVYIQPNKKQQRQSVSNPYALSTLFSGTSLLISIINLALRK